MLTGVFLYANLAAPLLSLLGVIMLLKIYVNVVHDFGTHGYTNEELHIIDRAENVIVHQGNYALPEFSDGSDGIIGRNFENEWGPTPRSAMRKEVTLYGDPDNGGTVRVIDYTRDGQSYRALISKLCYVCTDLGKTVEKLELYSGSRLSVA